MIHRVSRRVALPCAIAVCLSPSPLALAQQTLGSLNGSVTDPSGALLSGANVQLFGDANGIKLVTTSKKDGTYQFENLPVGNYTLSFTSPGFQTSRVQHVPVQENRTGTINIALKTGEVSETVNVSEKPLMNQTDATNGYVLDAQQIQETPLATGSFTRLATLAPGVSGELLSGIGTNAGLGNQPIWANGQRDTSNGFAVDGVDVTNLFNGKSSSESSSQRYAFNIGQGSATAGQPQTNTSVFGSNGQGLATPPPEFIQELRVNTSEYDAQQGNHSGAQIDVNTATGTNVVHGQVYGYRATNAFNADPYFNKQGVNNLNNLPAAYLNPSLHRSTLGATVGGPIVKNKLFFFVGGQYTHDNDQTKGISQFSVPSGLTNDRSTAGLLAAAASWNAASTAAGGKAVTLPTSIDPVAMALLNARLNNGSYLIPSVQNATIAPSSSNVTLLASSTAPAYQGIGDLDYNLKANDRLSLKYYYQHSPTEAPFTNSNTIGFPALEDSGAQVAALSNSITIGSKINWQQVFGFSRQKVYSTFQPQLADTTFGIGFPGGSVLPGLSLGKFSYSNGGAVTAGPNSAFANAGYFQNRWNPATNVIFTLGKHNLSAGYTFAYTQLNVRNRRTNLGQASTANFITFLEGQVSSSNELLGPANRYYRAIDNGAYVQDQWRILPNLSITAGVRFDDDGGLTEKYGNIFNFNPSLFSTSAGSVLNDGFVVAGNNALDPTQGTSNSTLTGRQWGIGPRVGFAYTPAQNGGKIVFHGGAGIYYDRGEYFSYLSQPAGSSTGGPFGATEAPPLVNYVTGSGTRTLENPLGSATVPTSSANPATFLAKLPTANQIRTGCAGLTVESAGGDCGVQPLNFGAYASNNKLPYIINFSFNVQTQLGRDTTFTAGYSGNRGRHLVIPVPFNEPGIATPTTPINGETSSYGYEVLNAQSLSGGLYNPIATEPYDTYDGGNIDLRVPYVGYSPNAALFEATGISGYDSLQTQIQHNFSKWVQFQGFYTFAHALDEQSDIGLFFTGDNPNNLHDSYASADFDRTHTFTGDFTLRLPDLHRANHLVSKFTNGWQMTGLVTLQSGQPYSLYEFNGAVGSLYFGNYPTLANPVIGIKDGAHPKSALTGASGAGLTGNPKSPYVPALNINQLAVNYVNPGVKGVPACASNQPCDYFENDFTPGQRNIFRQAPQRDADVSFQKITNFTERYTLRYSFDVYNISNTTSFDVPTNDANIGQSYVSGANGKTPGYGQVVSTQGQEQTVTRNQLYVFPASGSTTFGAVRNAIGQSRTIEMNLHFLF